MKSARRFKIVSTACGIVWAVFLCTDAGASVINEGFTTVDHLDSSATTGLWNIANHQAQAPVIANGHTVNFGDGSDGVLNSASGFAFDTNAHPNGYNFVSVNITGGTVTVTGSNPLVIRSLTTVNIAPTLDVGGGTGAAASTTPASSGPSGGTATAAVVTGGAGGPAFSTGTASQLNGGPGINGDGSQQISTEGAGSITGGTGASKGSTNPKRSGNGLATNFDLGQVLGGFLPGGGGGGGGGYFVSAADAAVGGGGGGAGGAIQISSVGAITLGNVNANGGNGGPAVRSGLNTACSGPGSGGNGGAIWIQSYNSITSPSPSAAAGAGGAAAGGAGCVSTSGGLGGIIRGDVPGATVAGWVGASFQDTTNAASNSSYVVQSKAYDLNTYNAVFSSAPTVSSQANGGSSPVVTYTGSEDGTNFTPFTTDITTLSNQHFRYVKFQISIQTGAAGVSPVVSSISINYDGPSLSNVDTLSLSAGCASLQRIGSDRKPPSQTGALMMLSWALVYVLIWRISRKSWAH